MVVAISGINIGLTIFGGNIDLKFGNKLFPSGENVDFGYWRSWKNDSVTSPSGLFNQIYMPFDGTGVKRSSKPEVFDRVSETNIIASGGHWERAGADHLNRGVGGGGQVNYVERSIYLNEYDYINVGSGNALGYTSKFTVYAKLMPSGEQLNTRIISKHNINPAQMVLGTDSQGLYYIRADGLDDDDENIAYQVKSDKEYSLYEFPTQVVGIFGYTSEGEGTAAKSSLALYVNGDLQNDISVRFNRNSPEDRRGDNVIIGNPEFAGSDGYRGWIDEVGIASYAISPSAVRRLWDNTFGLTNFINENAGVSGAYDFSFSQSFDAMDTNYVEFVIQSGNSQGQVGGAFDKSLWGTNNYAVSSQIYFDMDNLRGDAYQLTDNMYVDMWIKHETNHWSGGYLHPSIKIKTPYDTHYHNLNWQGSTIFLPSSVKRFQNIRFSGALDQLHPYSGGQNVFLQDGKRESKTDFNFHELNIALSYPSGTSEATTSQFRRNKPFQSSFKVYSAKVNVDAFVIPSTGTEELDLYLTGDLATDKTASVDLYLEAKEIVGSTDLYLQHNITKLRGSGLFSAAAVISTNKSATLYTKAGVSDDLRLNSLNLLLNPDLGPVPHSSGIDLFIDTAQFGTGSVRKLIDLFLDAPDPVPEASGFFVASGTKNLFLEGASIGRIGSYLDRQTGVTHYYQPGNRLSDPPYGGDTVNQFSRPLYTHGTTQNQNTNSMDLFVSNVFKAKTNDIPLFAKVAPADTKSGTLNLFLLRKSGELHQSTLFLKGPYASGIISLFNLGHTVKSSSISLYASGLGVLTNSSTHLVTKGYTPLG